MRMLKRKAEVFSPTDGIVRLCIDLPERSERGADFSDATLLDEVYPLAFRRMRISARDVELADSTGTELTVKVEVRHAPDLAPDRDAVVDGHAYEITRVEDRGMTCWLWLSETATDGQCTLVSSRTERDVHGIPIQTATETDVWCRKVERSTTYVTKDGTELRPQMELRIRSIDYDGETTLRRNGVTYTIIATSGAGKWLDLTCERKVADR